VGWSRWTTHLVGAAFAALVIPLLVGWALEPAGGNPGFLFQTTTDAVVAAWSDLVLAGLLFTPAYGHHLLVLGLITWGSSQFASYATFGHRRPINAVVVIGLLLLANMSLTVRDQLTFLVIFSIASLFLLVRFHTLDEQADWLRRRIGDPTAISALYLRGGTVFIIAAITGSLVLTGVASSDPLRGALDGRRGARGRVGTVPRAIPADLPEQPLARADVRRYLRDPGTLVDQSPGNSSGSNTTSRRTNCRPSWRPSTTTSSSSGAGHALRASKPRQNRASTSSRGLPRMSVPRGGSRWA
jgi:hypothetical protein